MGKSKKRIFHLGKNDRLSNLSRKEAVRIVAAEITSSKEDVYGLVTLFGLTAEELLEAGASYEAVMGIRGLLK